MEAIAGAPLPVTPEAKRSLLVKTSGAILLVILLNVGVAGIVFVTRVIESVFPGSFGLVSTAGGVTLVVGTGVEFTLAEVGAGAGAELGAGPGAATCDTGGDAG